jgi:uncharacterized protein involved in outer membrane biogenesis
MKVIKIAVIAVGVVVIAAAIFAAYGIPARGLIETYAGDALAKDGVKLDIAGSARFALWPTARLTIERLRLRDATSDDDLITVERVQAGVSLTDLLTGRIHVDDLALTRPVVNTDPMFRRARQATERRDRGTAAGSSPAAPIVLPVDSGVTIDAVSVENGTILIRDGRETVALPLDSCVSTPASAQRRCDSWPASTALAASPRGKQSQSTSPSTRRPC